MDQAIAAAYGWAEYTPDMPDAEILLSHPENGGRLIYELV
jgi:hypothetical protein